MPTPRPLATLLLTALAVAVLVLVGGALLPPHAALPVAPLVVPLPAALVIEWLKRHR